MFNNLLKTATSTLSSANKIQNLVNNEAAVGNDTSKEENTSKETSASSSTEENPCKPKELTTEEKKDQAREAYRKIIMEQKDSIIAEFNKALQTYLDSHLKEVDNNKLKEFIEDTLFSQMRYFFHNVNKSYVQYTILRKIFSKNKDRIMTAISFSILFAPNKYYIRNIGEHANAILQEFKNQLDIMDVNIVNPKYTPPPPSFTGGSNDADKISEIANWFPIQLDKNEVSSDIAYIVKESFQEIMNEDRMLAKTINDFLIKDIFPIVKKQMENYIGNNDVRVDIAILRAYVDFYDTENIIFKSIYNALYYNNLSPETVYNNIMELTLKDDVRHAQMGGKPRTRRRRINRASKTRQKKSIKSK